MNFVFPSNFVYWSKVKNHQEIKDTYYKKILENENQIKKNNSWLAELKTSFGDNELNKMFYSKHFASNVIWPYFDKMLKEMSKSIVPPTESYLSYCWYNLYEKGNFQEPHQHDKNYQMVDGRYHATTFCGIYFLHLEEENKTVFHQSPPIPCSIDNTGFDFPTPFLEEGDVIFFPSTLTHYVMPSESKRCTVSFNLTSVYDSANLYYKLRVK